MADIVRRVLTYITDRRHISLRLRALGHPAARWWETMGMLRVRYSAAVELLELLRL